jgi:hypothetical protein
MIAKELRPDAMAALVRDFAAALAVIRQAEVARLRNTLYELELLRAEAPSASPSCALRRRITTKPSCSIFRVCRARI